MIFILTWDNYEEDTYFEHKLPVKAESAEDLRLEINQKVKESLRKKQRFFNLLHIKKYQEEFRCCDFAKDSYFNILTLEEWYKEEGEFLMLVEDSITEIKRTIEELKTKLDRLESLSVAQVLATDMHEALCKDSHTDGGCAWHFYNWDQMSDVRADWVS